MVNLKEVWPWTKFERCVVVSAIRLKGEVNFFMREFWKSFAFLVIFFRSKKDFGKVPVLSNRFQLLGIEPIF